ncbi:MAG: hypothetical protein GQ535_13155 [Rhodobacteraceae bacterium]|nr:hypothetical protein [Paracoccaceae bacterium]
MKQGLPPVVIGFVLFGLLPGLLALADMALLDRLTFVGRLHIWNQPWLWLALVLLFAFIIDFRASGPRRLAVSKLDFWLVGLLLVQAIILGQTVSANAAAANLHVLRIGAALIAGVAGYYAMQHYGARFLRPVYVALLVGMLLTLPALIYYLYWVPEARVLGSATRWQMPGLGPVRVFGAALEAALLIGLALLASPEAKRVSVRAALLLSVLALWTMLIWSGARGALLSIMVATLVISALRPKIAVRLWAVLLITGVAGAALSLLIWTPEDISFGLWNMLDKTAQATVNEIGSRRTERWADSIGLIGQQPWFGHGLSQFSNLWPDYILLDKKNDYAGALPLEFLMYRHLHNVVLAAFLGLGILGGCAFIWLSVRNTLRAMHRVRQDADSARFPALLALVALLAHSFLTGIYVFPQTLMLIGLFFGICLAPNPAQNENING